VALLSATLDSGQWPGPWLEGADAAAGHGWGDEWRRPLGRSL